MTDKPNPLAGWKMEFFGVEVHRFEGENRLADDKAKLDLAIQTPKPAGRVTGPLFQTEKQADLFPTTKGDRT